ncbi:MAG TPA: phosphotransferase [Caulobacteraceae bacterium]|nr:phosphotransferase [Caulobacteraceae bacterium]
MARPAPDRDVASAKALARHLGLCEIQPVVLKLAHHTTLRLAPLPIVARVQSSEPPDAAMAAMAREVAVARTLADAGAPVIAPTRDPPAGPHTVGHAVISLWTFAEHRPATDADEVTAAEALRAVHAALAHVAGLPPFIDALDRCAAVLADRAAMHALTEADRAFLEARQQALRAGLDGAGPSVALHGDTHAGNVLMTADGPLWGDLESACRGPLEWDLVQLSPVARRLFEPYDRALLRRLSELRSVNVAVWCWADADRSRDVRAAGEHHLARVKAIAARATASHLKR